MLLLGIEEMPRNNKGQNKSGKFLIYLGLLLVVFSVSFLVYQKNQLESKKEDAIHLEKVLAQENVAEKGMEQNEASDEISASAVGVVRIDKLGVVLPILANTSDQALLDGVGVIESTDLPSSDENTITVLAGHRGGRGEDQTFLNINKLQNDDEIKITTREKVLRYKVVGQEIIAPTDWSKFTREEGKTKLILMSCHPYPQNYQRLLVKAELIQ